MAILSQGQDSIEAETILSFQQSLSKFTYSSRSTQDGRRLVPQAQSSKFCSNPSGPSQLAKRKRTSSEEGDELTTDNAREVSPKKFKMKRPVKRRGPADPEKYSHLRHINDCLEENLDGELPQGVSTTHASPAIQLYSVESSEAILLTVPIPELSFAPSSPGRLSAETGHHFAHPSNHFWKCLHLSGVQVHSVLPSAPC